MSAAKKDVKFLPNFIMSCDDRGAGSADLIDVRGLSEGQIHLNLSRRPRSVSGRGGREIFTFLERPAAQALGHYLLTQAQHQPAPSCPLPGASATLSCYNDLASGALVQGVVSAIRPAASDTESSVVILRIEVIHHGNRRAAEVEEASVVVERDQAYRFAQSLLALARG